MDTMLLFPLGREGDRRLADREVRAVVEPHALDAPPVPPRPVRRAEVDEPVRRALLHYLCVAARNVRILDPDVGVARPAEHRALLVEDAPLATPAQHRDLPLHPELDGRGGLGRLRPWLVDHRRTGWRDLGRSLLVAAPSVLRHAGGDAELADAEVVVGLEEDPRRRQQRVVLAHGVLGEVLLELRDERVLVTLELLAVARGEVDRVLVRHIHARDRVERCSSISFASLRASSTGWTFVRKARPKTPSKTRSSLCSIPRSIRTPLRVPPRQEREAL